MKPTQEQVIAWAREAGVWARLPDTFQDEFKAFAVLAYEAGRKDENERLLLSDECCRVCEQRRIRHETATKNEAD